MQKEKDVLNDNEVTGAPRRNVKVLFPVKRDPGTAEKSGGPYHADGAAAESKEKNDVRVKNAASAGRAGMLFLTRRRIYLFFIVLMTVFTVAGLCLYFRDEDKTAIAYNAFARYDGKADLINAFSACYAEVLFALVIFASGLTAFAPLFCSGCVSYFFLRHGFYSALYFERCLSSDHPFFAAAAYFVLTSASAFALIFYNAEVWKFSQISSEGVSRAFKKENFVPYLINLLLYSAVVFCTSYFLMFLF